MFSFVNLAQSTPHIYGSKAKLGSDPDVLDISTGPENLYLSEIDDVPELNKATTEQSRRSECLVESKGLTENSDRTIIRVKPNGELFPNPPRRLSPPRKHEGKKNRSKNFRLQNQSARDRRSLAKGNRLRSAIVKVKNRSEFTHSSQRKSISTSNSLSVEHNEHGSKPNKSQTLFSRIDPKIANSLSSRGEIGQKLNIATATITSQSSNSGIVQRIEKSLVSVGTQTDPCKCSQRNKQKNKNRRETAKLNRDIVKQLVDSEVIHISN